MAYWDTVLNSADAKLYGKRLIPNIVDDNARRQPDRICFSFPVCYTSLGEGFQHVNWRCFANAVNRMAHFLQREIGRSPTFQTVMYMGFPDIRIYIVLTAAIKTGHKVYTLVYTREPFGSKFMEQILFSSHGNSLAGHTNLIKQTDCKILLYTAGFPVTGILERCRLEPVQIPEIAVLLHETPSELFPYTKTFEEAKHDPCFVLHTSGSTGLPAPVVCTHWSTSTTDHHHLVAPLNGRPSVWGSFFDARRRNFLAFPMSSSSGVGAGITDVCFNNIIVVLGPPEQTTVDVMSRMLDHADIDSASCVPATLEELARSPEILPKLRKLTHIAYVGGSLSRQAGDVLSQYTRLVCLMASTETVTMVQHVTDPEDWSYLCINPILNGIEMRQVADLFELVYVRKPDCIDFQGIFKVFPHLLEYATRDLYSRHLYKPHHWRHEGRKDDIIVFRNGAKLNPMLHERTIATHPKVHSCMLIGTGRDKPAAIIQLHPQYYTEDQSAHNVLIQEMWPQVSNANDVADTYGQLEQRYVIFAKKEKPFEMGLKGNVQRLATARLYAKEIEDLYTSIADGGFGTLFRTESFTR